jgi:translation initiation factor IF-2
MAKTRAYKLAEELKLEPDEFIQKVRSFGIEVRSKMASIDEEQADEIRKRLGATIADARVERRVGSSVIRRRKRVDPVPPPEVVETPEAEAPITAAPVAEQASAEAVVEAPVVAEPEPNALPEQEAVAARAAPEEKPKPSPGSSPVRTVTPPTDTGREAPRRPARRAANQAANLKEQDSLARTMLGNVQHRLEQRRLIVERQSRLDPRRRRASATRKPAVAGAPAKKVVRLTGPIRFAEFATQSGVRVRQLLRKGRQLGLDLERDELIDVETAQLLAEDVGVEVEVRVVDMEEDVAAATRAAEEDLKPRSPVVTVMGHVDHGKTSLLDTIREANVVAGEAGGITQHIGAYRVTTGASTITFIDTPGHAAFTQMRARGAQVTDIVILVVAADDGIMPQTIEAISHAKASGAPIVVAINKIDLPSANVQRAKQGLLEHEVVLEEFGGDVLYAEVSATKGTNIDGLLEQVALQAEILDLKSRPEGVAVGTVIEAQLDRGRGPTATVLVKQGTLRRGDICVAGTVSGRVRSMLDDQGERLEEATPSMPVQIVGLSGVPEAGDELVVVSGDREAKALIEYRHEQLRLGAQGDGAQLSAEDVFGTLGAPEQREFNVVLKADVRGTAQAVRETVENLSTDKVTNQVLLQGIGGISESDVMLAATSGAIIYGFNVRPDAAARKLAANEGVEIRMFALIQELLEDMRKAMTGLLPPRVTEEVSGHAEVRQLFVIPKVGTVAGCAIPDGVIRRSNSVRVIRDGVSIYTSKLASLRHLKDDVREIGSGRECGMRIENFNDVKIGDILESFSLEETPDTL